MNRGQLTCNRYSLFSFFYILPEKNGLKKEIDALRYFKAQGEKEVTGAECLIK